jgi:hypothetical protein
MIPLAAAPLLDPVALLVQGRMAGPDRHPVPLAGTRYRVAIRGGLAEIRMVRRFVNREPGSIEAVLTFPLPVHAVLFELLLRVGGRTLAAHAQPRVAARATYEAAIEQGRLAVLHEELLRGIHMLSVGPVPPGAELEVEAGFALPLTLIDGAGHLRLPLTVGAVYGSSGLAEVDDLVGGAPAGTAALEVACDSGPVRLAGGGLVEGRATVPDNRPIDLEVSPWTPGPCIGRGADGRRVALDIRPAPAGEAPLHLAILVDHSGSMSGRFGAGIGETKHAVAIRDLGRVLAGLAPADRVELWEFDDDAQRVGTGRGATAAALVRRLAAPNGGTAIGAALDRVIDRSDVSDILLLTDGKSHDIDVAAIAARGRRCVVVLVGEDSLEANVGHLAALTGGEVLVAGGGALLPALGAALAGLRRPYRPARLDGHGGLDLALVWGGAAIATRWSDDAPPAADAPGARAAAAFAASLALRLLPAETATALAVAEGLAGPLTSLVLVDREGAVSSDLPSLRKIALAEVADGLAAACAPSLGLRADSQAFPAPPVPQAGAPAPASRGGMRQFLPGLFARSSGGFRASRPAPAAAGRVPLPRLPWSRLAGALAAGQLDGLDPPQADLVRRLAAHPDVAAFAAAHGLDPLRLAIGLLARRDSARDRHAARLAHRLLGSVDDAALARLAAAIGL